MLDRVRNGAGGLADARRAMPLLLQWHYAVDGYAGALLASFTAWSAVRMPAGMPLRRR